MDDQAQELIRSITGAWRTRVIYEGVHSGLLDTLRDEPRAAAECAGELGLDPETTHRILRALAVLGLARQVSAREFTATACGALLSREAAGSVRNMALLWGSRLWESLETIGGTLQTGRPGWGNGDFASINADPKASDTFNRAMAEQSAPIARAAARACDFSAFRHVLDVGGGYGSVLAAILQAHPGLTGSVCDLPSIAAGATRYLEEAGVGDRARFIDADFFRAIPPGADCLVVKYILHDWPDADCLRILRNCREAQEAGSTTIILERVMPDIVTPADEAVVRTDLVMMPISGKERTFDEYERLLHASGFSVAKVTPLVEGCSAIECRAV